MRSRAVSHRRTVDQVQLIHDLMAGSLYCLNGARKLTSIFTSTVTPSLISGDSNKLKVTFRNSGKTDLKVNLIVGTVSEADDFSNVIRNVSVICRLSENDMPIPFPLYTKHKLRWRGG